MEMTLTIYLQVGLVLATAAVIQGAAGFAFGLFAMPLLLFIGLAPAQAIAMVAASATCQAAMGVWALRRDVAWSVLAKVAPVAVLTVPVGVWLLEKMSAMDQSVVRQIFGAIVLAVLATQWLLRVQPREHVPLGWGWLAMAGAGLGTGIAGMASPATVPWVTAHQWPSQRIRGTMWVVFLVVTPPNALFLYHRFGPSIGEALWQGGVFLPAVMLATLPGIWLGNRLGTVAMRRVALALLLAVGIYAIAQPLLWPGL